MLTVPELMHAPVLGDRPLWTSAFFQEGRGPKIGKVCRRIVVKKMPTKVERGEGVKSGVKFADVLNGCSNST